MSELRMDFDGPIELMQIGIDPETGFTGVAVEVPEDVYEEVQEAFVEAGWQPVFAARNADAMDRVMLSYVFTPASAHR